MGSIEYYVLNLGLCEDFAINLEGYAFEICKLKNHDEIMNKLKDDKDLHQIGYTAKIRITHDDLNKEETAKITEIIDIICELLSYATGNGVISSYYVIKNGNNTVEKTIRSCFTKRYVKDAQVIDNKDLKGFLKSTYDNYKKWRDIFGLNILFEIMNYSKSFNIMQFDILILCVALEYLSNKTLQYYESKDENIDSSLLKNKQKKLEKILKDNGISDDEITGKIIEECKTKGILYSHPSLKDCIVKLKKEFDISYKEDTKPKYPTTENVSKKDKKDIYQIRNDIVHKLHIDDNIYWDVYPDIHLLINIIILRILGYSGKFYPCRCLKNKSCDMCEFIKNS
jgi:hypothetical protein